MFVPFLPRSAVFEDFKSDIFRVFDPFSCNFSTMQRIPINSVSSSYGFLSVVFRLVTVGKRLISSFRQYCDPCCFFMHFSSFGRFRVFFQ